MFQFLMELISLFWYLLISIFIYFRLIVESIFRILRQKGNIVTSIWSLISLFLSTLFGLASRTVSLLRLLALIACLASTVKLFLMSCGQETTTIGTVAPPFNTGMSEVGESSSHTAEGSSSFAESRLRNSIRSELWRMLDNQFVYARIVDTSGEFRLADEHVAADEYQAAFMVHESLLTHIDSVRCPVYAMVFRWFEDERRDPVRASDPTRFVTRRIIQMLAYRAAVEPRYFHDVFFSAMFGSVVGQFIHVTQLIEREASHAEQRETWFDLMGCLFEYANMPLPGGPSAASRESLSRHLSDLTRRRMALRMLRSRGRRDRRMQITDIVWLRGIASVLEEFDLTSRISVLAMMDSEVRQQWRASTTGERLDDSLHAPIAPSYPVWPSPEEATPQFDPLTDAQPLPVRIYRLGPHEASEQAARVNLDHLSLEPHRSLVAPYANWTLIGQSRPRRALLTTMSMYYYLRLKLIGTREHPLRPQYFWSKLPIEAAFELSIIALLLPDLRRSVHITPMTMAGSVEVYRSIGAHLEALMAQQQATSSHNDITPPLDTHEHEFYRQLFRDMLRDIQNLRSYFDTNLWQKLHKTMSCITELMMQTKSRDFPPRTSPDEIHELSLENCMICLMSLNEFMEDHNEERREHFRRMELNCGHKFHWNCIYQWFFQSPVTARACPVCILNRLNTDGLETDLQQTFDWP